MRNMRWYKAPKEGPGYRGIAYLVLAIAFLALATSPVYAGPGGGTFYANSPQGIWTSGTGTSMVSHNTGTALRKFVDRLPGLGLPGCTVSAIPGTGTCNENALGAYIPIAQADTATYTGSDYYVLGLRDYTQKMHSDLAKPTKLRGYYQINTTGTGSVNHYLGPVILAAKDRPVRILFENKLGTGAAGNLFLPLDTTVMGANTGFLGTSEMHTQNRAVIHLHGGHTPWISDGTPHQWITPPLDPTNYKKGLSFQNVPDMIGAGKSIPAPAPGDGLATYYYTNQQSSRLIWYHDHTYGITRLNAYAGEASGYLITDPAEEALITARDIPNICPGSETTPGILCEYKYGIPLIVQDKTFVPADVATQDALWSTSTWGNPGDLWFPHVYEPNQDPGGGLIATGRWDYGPLVWPPSPVSNPTLPALSTVPEAFMDTPLVNGTAYPYLAVEPKAYRFRILSAGNDRSFNLQLYYGANAAGAVCAGAATPASTCTEVKMVDAIPRQLCATGITTNCTCDPTALNGTPVGCFPSTWPTDGRAGGVPDPLYAGPEMIQIGSEAGLLPAPVVLPNHPITFDDFGNIANKTLLAMPGERADVLIDFSAVPPGSTLVLYNDAPAALPGGDPRYDYYTGNPDQTASGGAPSTLPGFGPNTRTVMQFRVINAVATAPVTTINMATLPAALAAAYTAGQPAHIVPDGVYSKLTDTAMTVNSVSIPFKGKSINEGFDPVYGRINAMLGLEAPDGLTPPVPLEYIAPPTEIMGNGQVQLWKITHNGVDSHPIHFHLMDVQVVNRVGWDGSVNPPDPSEMGWKETVRMNPMEDVIIAAQPTGVAVPFTIPDSMRPLDVTQPVSAANPLTNFGWEYVWHCHILGHEEFDLMRPIVFSPDARNEILWRNASTGDNLVWNIDGVTRTSTQGLPPVADLNWKIVGRGDFNGDGNPDILWRNTATGANLIWYMNGVTHTNTVGLNTVADLNWTIAGVGDFNGDGNPDILWRNTGNGINLVWYMNGATQTTTGVLPTVTDQNWTIVGVGDFNGDGKPDILWRNTAIGANLVWYMSGVTQTSSSALPVNVDQNWTIVGVGDFNSDAYPDVLWRNVATGANMVWYLNGVTQIGTGTVDPVTDQNWKIVGK